MCLFAVWYKLLKRVVSVMFTSSLPCRGCQGLYVFSLLFHLQWQFSPVGWGTLWQTTARFAYPTTFFQIIPQRFPNCRKQLCNPYTFTCILKTPRTQSLQFSLGSPLFGVKKLFEYISDTDISFFRKLERQTPRNTLRGMRMQ